LVGFTIPFTLAGLVAYDHRAEWEVMIQLYSYVRNTTVIISLLVLLRIYYILRQTSNQEGHKSNNHPLYHLLQRLVWYPVIQGITRFCGSLYILVYGQIANSYPENAGTFQTICLYIVVVGMPLAGIGSFLVFVSQQHGARDSLITMLGLQNIIKLSADSSNMALTNKKSSNIIFPPSTEEYRHQSLCNMDEAELVVEIVRVTLTDSDVDSIKMSPIHRANQTMDMEKEKEREK